MSAQSDDPFDTPTDADGRPAPYLLTPGPLTTAASVRQAMLQDWGSWDSDFREMTSQLRRRLLEILGDNAVANGFECVPVQGSGTYAVEAMLGTILPRDSKSLVLINGAYGKRIAETLSYMGRAHSVIDKGDFLPPRAGEVQAALDTDTDLTHVIAVHCETSSGILNPLQEIADVVDRAGCKLLIDSMSAFGAIPISPESLQFDALVSSANKCIEGVPGFGFMLAKRSVLQASEGQAHSLSLDLFKQWQYMESTGQWRFTPPTHSVAAFLQALEIHKLEGGVAGRLKRYTDNRDELVDGMKAIGFETLLAEQWLSPIIVTFFNPADEQFSFSDFYDEMKHRGFIIYPGKLTEVDSFRIGCIGRMDKRVMRAIVQAAGESLAAMGVNSAAPPQSAFDEREKLMGTACGLTAT